MKNIHMIIVSLVHNHNIMIIYIHKIFYTRCLSNDVILHVPNKANSSWYNSVFHIYGRTSSYKYSYVSLYLTTYLGYMPHNE